MSSTTYSVRHFSGKIEVVMNDCAEEEFDPVDAALTPPGHNAWVVGNELVIAGLKVYAERNYLLLYFLCLMQSQYRY
ncbi:MAG: hypothetical protein GEU26_10370 [Nitrososphaeraceae archaeon]|nr:hypothetical protein [Nitrososphaeraceae archaeon]